MRSSLRCSRTDASGQHKYATATCGSDADLAVQVGELEVEEAAGEAAEAQVWAEACWAGQQ